MTAKEILGKLVSFDVLSKQNNLSLVNWISSYIGQYGIETVYVYNEEKTQASLHCRIGPSVDGGIILSGHTDVVPVSKGWSSDPFTATIKDDRLYGRGSCDMKGFIACTLAYAKVFKETNLDRDIHFCYTFDEETACIGAPLLIKELKKRNIKNGICIIGEPTNMKIQAFPFICLRTGPETMLRL